jgi:hypothetical protein
VVRKARFLCLPQTVFPEVLFSINEGEPRPLPLQKSLIHIGIETIEGRIGLFHVDHDRLRRQAYQVRATRFKDFLCLLSDQGEKSFFFPPIGEGDVMDCYRALGQYRERINPLGTLSNPVLIWGTLRFASHQGLSDFQETKGSPWDLFLQ